MMRRHWGGGGNTDREVSQKKLGAQADSNGMIFNSMGRKS